MCRFIHLARERHIKLAVLFLEAGPGIQITEIYELIKKQRAERGLQENLKISSRVDEFSRSDKYNTITISKSESDNQTIA